MAGDASESSTDFPLDSPNWWPQGKALEYCRSQPLFRFDDLVAAVEQELVHVKVEYLDDSTKPAKRKSQRLTSEFFQRWAVVWFWDRLAFKARTPGATLRRHALLYFWRPDLERHWSPVFPPSEPAPEKAKPEPEAALDESAAAATATTAPSPTSEPAPPPLEGPLHPLRHGPQIDRVYPALRKEFPLYGKAPKSLSIKRVAKRLRPHWEAENKDLKKEDRLPDPSEDVVAAAVEQLGRGDH
jgi:hypothetical protein